MYTTYAVAGGGEAKLSQKSFTPLPWREKGFLEGCKPSNLPADR